jgi:virulence factor Mce-like protein
MRRIALTALLVMAAAWGVAAVAGADGSHTYKVQMYNAFGLVKGSDVRVAGVNAGSVTALDIDASKRAVLTIELSGPASVLGEDTRCSSEPQSLIAEYFLDCRPKGPPLAENGEIPASHVRQTVQPDLVQNTLRMPYAQRLQLIINEFGTALAGNPQDLNEAIRKGAPALTQLKRVTGILASQNRTIRDLNANSDKIIAQLNDRRDDVVRFIQTARDTAAASAERRTDLSTDFDRLDNFLAQLKPTMAKLDQLAIQQTPLLSNLHAAAPQLNTLAANLPAFNKASTKSLASLGKAAVPGRQALRQGLDEIQALKRSGQNATPVAENVDKFLLDISSPKRAPVIDQRAAKTCGHKTKPCYSTGRKAPTGYTGMEGLLNYAYYQTLAINQYDQIGHLLHFSLFGLGTSPCGEYNAGGEGPDFGVPKAQSLGGGTTTDLTKTDPCVSWFGASQPGIGGPNSDIGHPRYDKSVCPTHPADGSVPYAYGGSQDTSLCDPNVSASSSSASKSTATRRAQATAEVSPGQSVPSGTGQGPLPQLPPSSLPKPGQNQLPDILGLGNHGGVPPAVGGHLKGGDKTGGANGKAAKDLLDFLLTN